MEALHKQTLPFLLRRVKEDVLQDLPPKIIQDYYCELSPLQVSIFLHRRKLGVILGQNCVRLLDSALGDDLCFSKICSIKNSVNIL